MKKITGILLLLGSLHSLHAQLAVSWHNALPFASSIINTEVKAQEVIEGYYFRLVEFDQLVGPELKSRLLVKGIEILEFISNHSYVCKIKYPQADRQSDDGINYREYPISASHKMSESILQRETCHGNEELSRIVLQYYPGISEIFILAELEKQNITYSRIEPYVRMVYCTVPIRLYTKVADLPWVSYMACESPSGEPEDRESRSLHRVNAIGNNSAEGLFLTGQGVKVMVRDDGIVGPHIDFQGRLQNEAFGVVGTHGDMVSGILCGAGNLDPTIEGMAPGADLYILNYQADFLDRTLELHRNDGVVITNSSYSDGCNIGYTIGTQIVDKQIYENPSLIHVFSAGNSNGADCGYGAGNQWGNVTGGHKIGKNVLTTANLRIDGTLETSSSRGPVKDGRLKPEISARGTGELTTAPNNGIQVGGGTSAASPGIAGVCALLYQAFKENNNGQNPESALIKATIMNTATDIGVNGPDYQFGFGVVNAYNAYKLIKENRFQKVNIQQGDSLTFSFDILQDYPLTKFMIYWAEEASSVLARKALINDIDMEVIDPNGTVFKPWQLNPTPDANSLAKEAQKGTDTLHNYEQVSINFPIKGRYTVKVYGKFLPSFALPFYLLHELEEKELKLTFPIGGEKLDITEFTQIHFKAFGSDSIEGRFSPDAGRTWENLGKKPAYSRFLNWTVPFKYNSDSCLIEIRQGTNIDLSSYFTITPLVPSFDFQKYCPDGLELKWTRIKHDSFLIYRLGEKYMEPIAVTNATSIYLPLSNIHNKEWYSIAGYTRGALSRRQVAISTPDSTVNCNFAKDASLHIGGFDTEQNIIGCEELFLKPKIQVVNRTANPIGQFSIMSWLDGKVVSRSYTAFIDAFDTTTVQYNNPLQLQQNGHQKIAVWIEFSGDENKFNDTFYIPVNFISIPAQTAVYPMTESFSANNMPANWTVFNPIPFSNFSFPTVKVRGGSFSRVLGFKNENTIFIGEKIAVSTRPADLTQSIEPYLYFNFAVQGRTTSFVNDSIRITVKSICDTDPQQKEILYFATNDLIVDTSNAGNWNPAADSSWYSLAYDLSDFKGKKVVTEFQWIRGYNNWTYVDNISIREKDADTKKIDFTISQNPNCFNKTIIFDDSTEISTPSIRWDFGAGAGVRFAKGAGPFSIRYVNAGEKKIIYKLQSPLQDIILTKYLTLVPAASPNFIFKIISGRTVAFEDMSANTQSYTWDFNDGTKSTERNPIHTFDSSKLYRVKLTVSNICGNPSKTVIVDLSNIVSTKELAENNLVKVYPNPGTGNFTVEFPGEILEYQVYDIQGRKQIESSEQFRDGFVLRLDNYPAGSYFLRVKSERGVYYTKIENIQ